MASPSAAAALTLHSLGGASARPRFAAVGADSAPKDDADDRTRLSDGEYRTVLAAQRTLLAFLRTALAVLVVFRDSAFGPVLASTVAAMGIFQFATAAPLYLTAALRESKPDGGKGGRACAKPYGDCSESHCCVQAYGRGKPVRCYVRDAGKAAAATCTSVWSSTSLAPARRWRRLGLPAWYADLGLKPTPEVQVHAQPATHVFGPHVGTGFSSNRRPNTTRP